MSTSSTKSDSSGVPPEIFAHLRDENEVRRWLFAHLVSFFRGYFTEETRERIERIIHGLPPEVPTSTSHSPSWGSPLKTGLAGAAITLFMCFGVVAIWTWCEGRFFPVPGNGILEFWEDHVNVVNYLVVCPAYVGAGSALIHVTLQHWSRLTDHAEQLGADIRPNWWTGPAVAFLILGVSSLMTANYVGNTLDPSIYRDQYWFIEGVGPSGQRMLGALGVYYAVLNFSLLTFTLTVLGAFLSMISAAVQFGSSLTQDIEISPAVFGHFRDAVGGFTTAYVCTKVVLAAYMANALTWQLAHLKATWNLILTGALLSILAFIVLPLPRFGIEHQWLKIQSLRTEKSKDLRLEKLPTFWEAFVSRVADGFVITGFLTGFWLHFVDLTLPSG